MFTLLKGFESHHDTLTDELIDLVNLFHSPYVFEQNMVKMIDQYGRSLEAFNQADLICRSENLVTKIEGMEKLNAAWFNTFNLIAKERGHLGPVTCHLFQSKAGAKSFPLHTDPDDVIIVMLKGKKVFRNEGESISLTAGDFMLIPKNYPHEAVNTESNLMLSIGLESFIVEKL